MQSTTIIRSVLFVPGNQPDRINKAMATEADVVIMDLEDAVPKEEKKMARSVVREKLNQNQNRKMWVRVNGPDTKWIRDDIEAVTTQGISGIMVPKLEKPNQAAVVYKYITECGEKQEFDLRELVFIPLIETALSVQNAYNIATASIDSGNIFTLAFGAADFTADMGINMTDTGEELNYPRAKIAVACRAAGIRPPLDTPYMINIKDTEGLEKDAQRARNLGFQGKLCVHPAQLEVVNDVFSPSQAEIEFAKRVIDAYERATREGRGAVQVDGKLVDPPIMERARQIVKWENSRDRIRK